MSACTALIVLLAFFHIHVLRAARSIQLDIDNYAKASNSLSVFTMNLWGDPQSFDATRLYDTTLVKLRMQALHAEIQRLKPWVVGFEEYNQTAFDTDLVPFYEEYSKCRTSNKKSTIVVAVRKDIQCRVGEMVLFDELDACAEHKHARQLIQVEVMVGEIWVTVGVVHLKSGGSLDTYKCKMASVERSFEVLLEKGRPGVLMGDFNWFGYPGGIAKPKKFEFVRPWKVVKAEKAAKKRFYATSTTRTSTTTTTPKAVMSSMVKEKTSPATPKKPKVPIMSFNELRHHEDFMDADEKDDFATFPAWDPDMKHPRDRWASRLDRIFYTRRSLEEIGEVTLVNPRVRESENGDPKYDFVSDHAGNFAEFSLLRVSSSSEVAAVVDNEEVDQAEGDDDALVQAEGENGEVAEVAGL